MKNSSKEYQLPIEFYHQPYMGDDDFIKAPCNEEAYKMIDNWQNWPFFALCLYGKERSGKTHLAHIFSKNISIATNYPYLIPNIEAKKINLNIIDTLFAQSPFLIIENLSEDIDEEAMFHLYNHYQNQGGKILFTATKALARMNIKLPDLKSRLNIVPTVEIKEPDDYILSALIVKLFMDRQIIISVDIINYILLNMERSFAYAHKLVEQVDRLSLTYKRAITIPLIKEAMSIINDNKQTSLF